MSVRWSRRKTHVSVIRSDVMGKKRTGSWVCLSHKALSNAASPMACTATVTATRTLAKRAISNTSAQPEQAADASEVVGAGQRIALQLVAEFVQAGPQTVQALMHFALRRLRRRQRRPQLLDFSTQRIDVGGAGARLREVALQLLDE